MEERTIVPTDGTTDATTDGRPGIPRRLLGVWAHPDDEAYLASILMSRVVANGGHVTLMVVTDGELGFSADDERPLAERKAQRRSEMARAMDVIGVHDIRFLGLPDGGVAAEPTDRLAEHIASVIRTVAPDAITTFGPDGVTGHEDHVATGAATTTAWLATATGDLWYAAKTVDWLSRWRRKHDDLGIWMTHEPRGYTTDELLTVVDLDDREVRLKRRVLAGHASQTATVSAAFGESSYIEWIRQESFRRPTAGELRDFGRTRAAADRVVLAPDGCTKYLVPA